MKLYMTTAEAAKALDRSPKTLYGWASRGKGPLKPEKGYNGYHGRLLWPTKTINKLVAKGFLDRPSTQAY